MSPDSSRSRPASHARDGEVRSRLPETETDRPPLLFVHGAYHGPWCWDEHWMPTAAERGWPTYAVSLRGHGDSDDHDRPRLHGLGDYAEDVMQVITSLPRRPVLIGHSMGGLVVQRVLREYRPRAVVLVASVPSHGGYRLPLRIARRHPTDLVRLAAFRPLPPRADYFFSDRLDRDRAEALGERLSPESALTQVQMGMPRRAPDVDIPVLVLGGEEDALIDPADAVRTAKAFGTQARLFRGMGHDLMLDAGWRAPLEVTLHWLEETLEDLP